MKRCLPRDEITSNIFLTNMKNTVFLRMTINGFYFHLFLPLKNSYLNNVLASGDKKWCGRIAIPRKFHLPFYFESDVCELRVVPWWMRPFQLEESSLFQPSEQKPTAILSLLFFSSTNPDKSCVTSLKYITINSAHSATPIIRQP